MSKVLITGVSVLLEVLKNYYRGQIQVMESI